MRHRAKLPTHCIEEDRKSKTLKKTANAQSSTFASPDTQADAPMLHLAKEFFSCLHATEI